MRRRSWPRRNRVEVRRTRYPDVEFLIRDHLGFLCFRLGYPDESSFVAMRRQVAIDTVVTSVEPTADEPLPKRRVASVQRRVPIMVPGEQIRVFLEALRKVLLTEPFKDTRIACVCLTNKPWRGLIVLLLPPVNGDMCSETGNGNPASCTIV